MSRPERVAWEQEQEQEHEHEQELGVVSGPPAVPTPPGGHDEKLPVCPRPGHESRRVVKDGVYGTPPRQRYRCVGEVVNPTTGKISQFHRFTPPLPRLLAEPCDVCGTTELHGGGPIVSRGYAFPVREIAAAFIAVGAGASYAHAADRARVSVGRRRLDGERGGALVAEWLDLFGTVILDAYAENAWPETLVLARIAFTAKQRGSGHKPVAFNVLGAYGCEAGARRGRVWALQASYRAEKADWVDFLRSLDVSGAPRIVLADGEEAIGDAVHEVWPSSVDQDTTLPMCTKHRSARGGAKTPVSRSLRNGQRITAIPMPSGPQFTLPTSHSTMGLRAALARVSDFLEPRSFGLRNKRRTNIALGLIRLHLNGVDIDRRYNMLLREYIESVDEIPRQRGGKDTGSGPRTDAGHRTVSSLRS